MSKLCPCHSQITYNECCFPYLNGDKIPVSIEALMRSRYTAYHNHNMAYIIHTMSGKALDSFYASDPSNSSSIQWVKLEVHSVNQLDQEGTVEFVAHYLLENIRYTLHEKSFFIKQNGRWLYVDGQLF